MNRLSTLGAFLSLGILTASPAYADELFAGVGSQDIATPVAMDTTQAAGVA